MRAAALLLVLVLASGCLQPFRAHVDEAVVAASPHDWRVRVGAMEGSGLFGDRQIETRYTFNPSSGPPFPAVLQVLSVRGWDRLSTSELLAIVEELVETTVPQYGIVLDHGADRQGERVLASGMVTRWLVREGTSVDDGALFDEDSRVRILGEVGHDGRSSTSVIVLAIAQVSRTDRGPLGAPLPTVSDARTWIELVGDPNGSVDGYTKADGFVHSLRTHA